MAAAASSKDIPDIKLRSTVLDLSFHPAAGVVALGLVDGSAALYQYGPGTTKRVGNLNLSADSIRTLAFHPNGHHLYTGSSDQSISCVDHTSTVIWRRAGAHGAGVYIVQPLAENVLASGDDDGVIKLWDTRTMGGGGGGGGGAGASAGAGGRGGAGGRASGSAGSSAGGAPAVATLSAHEDVIHDLLFDADRHTLVSASGDATLGVWDLRKGGKPLTRTEPDDRADEALSLALIKGGTAVVAGTQDGVLQIYQWGAWTKDPERFTGHPESIDALLMVDSDTLVTGSSDGILRLVTVRPNKLVGVLGEHADFPLERLRWDRTRAIIGSASHDDTVKFWDVAYLYEEDDDEEEEEEAAGPSSSKPSSKSKTSNKTKTGGGKSKFTDLPALSLPARGGDSDDEDDDDDDDEEDDDDDGDDDDEALGEAGAGPSSAGAGSGAGGPSSASAGAGAAADDDDDMDGDGDEDEDEDDKKARRKKPTAKGKKRFAKASQAEKSAARSKGEMGKPGFFDDL